MAASLQPLGEMMALDWNDLGVFLAVMEHGSTKKAATALRIDQTTCARRIGALEAALGIDLFTRDGGRYAANSNALALRDAAAKAGSAIGAFKLAASQLRRTTERVIKVTCEEFWAPILVLPAIAKMQEQMPEIRVELEVSPISRDVLAGEADLALRSSLAPIDGELIWRKLDDDPIAIYCAETYPNPPTSLDDLADCPFIGHTSHVQRLREAGAEWDFRHLVNSWQALLGLLRLGSAVSMVPVAVARSEPCLRRCFDLPVNSAHWLVYRPADRTNRNLRQLIAALEASYRSYSASSSDREAPNARNDD